MQGFKKFFKQDEDVNSTLAKLPKSHRDLVKGYSFKFEPKNTLSGDTEHVGLIRNHPKKEVIIASPWNYGREFTLLHEIGHLVYEAVMRQNKELSAKWEAITKATKHKKKDESPEELFCHAYANTYAKNKIEIHNHPEWEEFIRSLPQ